MMIASSWVVENGWSRPLGSPPPNVLPRTEAAPSMRGKPPEPGTKTARDSRDPMAAFRAFMKSQRRSGR